MSFSVSVFALSLSVSLVTFPWVPWIVLTFFLLRALAVGLDLVMSLVVGVLAVGLVLVGCFANFLPDQLRCLDRTLLS